MNRTLWVNTDNTHIFPDEEEARRDYQAECDLFNEPFSEQGFRNTYVEISFAEYNKEVDNL